MMEQLRILFPVYKLDFEDLESRSKRIYEHCIDMLAPKGIPSGNGYIALLKLMERKREILRDITEDFNSNLSAVNMKEGYWIDRDDGTKWKALETKVHSDISTREVFMRRNPKTNKLTYSDDIIAQWVKEKNSHLETLEVLSAPLYQLTREIEMINSDILTIFEVDGKIKRWADLARNRTVHNLEEGPFKQKIEAIMRVVREERLDDVTSCKDLYERAARVGNLKYSDPADAFRKDFDNNFQDNFQRPAPNDVKAWIEFVNAQGPRSRINR